MLELSMTAQKKRRFLGYGREFCVEAKFCPPWDGKTTQRFIPVSAFLESFLQNAPEVMPALEKFETNNPGGEQVMVIEDLRGRPSETFKGADHSEEEELFFSSGVAFRTPPTLEDYDEQEPDFNYSAAEPEQREDNSFQSMPFSYRVTSRFERLNGSRHIVHRVQPVKKGAIEKIQPSISVRDIAKLVPFRLDRIRIGIEAFRSRMWGSMLGATPYIFSRFYLELSPTEIRLFAREELDKKGRASHMKDDGLLGAFDRALVDTDLFSGFFAKVQEAA